MQSAETGPGAVHHDAFPTVRRGADLPRLAGANAQAHRAIVESDTPQVGLGRVEWTPVAGEARPRIHLETVSPRCGRHIHVATVHASRGGDGVAPPTAIQIPFRAGDDDAAAAIVRVLADLPLLIPPDSQAGDQVVQ